MKKCYTYVQFTVYTVFPVMNWPSTYWQCMPVSRLTACTDVACLLAATSPSLGDFIFASFRHRYSFASTDNQQCKLNTTTALQAFAQDNPGNRRNVHPFTPILIINHSSSASVVDKELSHSILPRRGGMTGQSAPTVLVCWSLWTTVRELSYY